MAIFILVFFYFNLAVLNLLLYVLSGHFQVTKCHHLNENNKRSLKK